MKTIETNITEKLLSKRDAELYSPAHCMRILKALYHTRMMDDKMGKLVRQNKGGTFHLSVSGHELVGAVCAVALKTKKDWAFPYYRDRGFAIGLGCCLVEILGAFLARDVPNHSGGRMMPEHFSDFERRIPCQSSVVGSQFLQAVGLAKAIALRDLDEVVYVSAGEGATSQGDFHEALNFSCIHQLPIVFVIQDNDWAISVSTKEQTAGRTITKIAKGFEGLSVHDVDGCDYIALSHAMREAVSKARMKKGPSLIVAKVPRIGPHSSSDDPKKYKTDAIIEEELSRDPIPRFEKWVIDQEIFSFKELEEIKKKCFQEIEEVARRADALPFPEKKTASTRVFKESMVVDTTIENREGESIVIMDGLNHALREEMERDPHVVVFGQDVAHGKGGVFGITRNLTKDFGSDRCFNTPLAESTIVGLATGMTFDGKMRPVAEIQFVDYSWTALNQLINELSSIYYRSNGQWNCPVVIRMPYGGYIQGGPYHSQSNEAYFSHCPGLKVVVPSNAADAKCLLKAAIRDPNPVIFLEHKALYRQRIFCARPEPGPDEILPLGKASVVRKGSDVTVICWGMMVPYTYEVAETLEKEEGISTEVIDLRTMVPLDMETILRSIEKTSKVLIVHEAAKNCGFGAELAARAVEEAFIHLDAPVKRVAGKNCAVPYCKSLEDEVLPQKEDIAHAIKELARF